MKNSGMIVDIQRPKYWLFCSKRWDIKSKKVSKSKQCGYLIIFSETLHEDLQHDLEVTWILSQRNLTENPEKIKFVYKEIKFLGYRNRPRPKSNPN